MQFNVVDRIVRPRRENGSDWDSQRIVLCKYGTKELWWWTSRKSWQDRLVGYQYEPGELVTADVSRAHLFNTVHNGGRLSKKLLETYAAKIDEFFGVPGLTNKLSPKTTLVVE